MKRLLWLLTILLFGTTVLYGCGGGHRDDPPPQAPEKPVEKNSWEFLDGNGLYGLNKDVTKGAIQPRLAEFGNRLYATWYEWNGAAQQVRVAAYDGASWSFVDGNGLSGINRDPNKPALTPDIAAAKGRLYVAWSERNPADNRSQIRVAEYDGTSWSFADGGGPFGINRDGTRDAFSPRLAVWRDKLYIAWFEWSDTVTQIRVAGYDGTSWSFADGGGPFGINKNISKDASVPALAVWRDRLYAAWSETTGAAGQIRVAEYDGAGWSFVDGGGPFGINRHSSNEASSPSLTVWNDRLAVAWSEWNSVNQIYVATYDGASWAYLSGTGDSEYGLNRENLIDASDPCISVWNGSLFAAWSEWNSARQIRVAKFESGSWRLIDQGEKGANKSVFMTAANPCLIVFQGRLLAAWNEADALNSTNQIRLASLLD